jgi:hypothetical protein
MTPPPHHADCHLFHFSGFLELHEPDGRDTYELQEASGTATRVITRDRLDESCIRNLGPHDRTTKTEQLRTQEVVLAYNTCRVRQGHGPSRGI